MFGFGYVSQSSQVQCTRTLDSNQILVQIVREYTLKSAIVVLRTSFFYLNPSILLFCFICQKKEFHIAPEKEKRKKKKKRKGIIDYYKVHIGTEKKRTKEEPFFPEGVTLTPRQFRLAWKVSQLSNSFLPTLVERLT